MCHRFYVILFTSNFSWDTHGFPQRSKLPTLSSIEPAQVANRADGAVGLARLAYLPPEQDDIQVGSVVILWRK